MDIVNEAPDTSFNSCDAGTYQAAKELKIKILNISSIPQGQDHIKYLESGCSRQMICLNFQLNDLMEKYGHIITFGDSSEGAVNGVGTIRFKSVELKDVFYVKGFQKNLISINQLCDNGYNVLFD